MQKFSGVQRSCDARQGCQMLDKKYGTCLSYLWQFFGKKFLKMAIFLAIFIFHHKMAILGNIDFIVFAIHIFSMLSIF